MTYKKFGDSKNERTTAFVAYSVEKLGFDHDPDAALSLSRSKSR